MIADILPVPVLAEPCDRSNTGQSPLDSGGEARESTESSESLTGDSRGGQKIPANKRNKHIHTDWRFGGAGIHKAAEIQRSSGQKIKQDAAYYRSYRARNKGRIQKQEEKRRARDRNRKWVVQTTAGVPDVGWKVLSDFRVDVAMRAFWAKRKMAVPSATMGGILPSVSDFNEEVTILQMRTCI